jgi:membrane protein
MARIQDIPVIVRRVGVLTFARRVWREMNEDELLVFSAALAYSWLFAFFPFFLALLALVPYVPGADVRQTLAGIHDVLEASLPHEAANTIWVSMRNRVEEIQGGRAQALLGVGLAVAFWAASGGMQMTMVALDKCFEIERGRAFYKRRPIAIGLTIAVICLILSVLVLVPVGTLIRNWVLEYKLEVVSFWALWLVDLARWSLAVLAMLLVVAILYHFGPSLRRKWRFVTPGAVFSVVVWVLLAYAFKFYVNHFGRYHKTYGAVGGVAILLLFFYIDALVLLVGAEINSEIDYEVLKVPRGCRDLRPYEIAAAGKAEAAKAGAGKIGVAFSAAGLKNPAHGPPP